MLPRMLPRAALEGVRPGVLLEAHPRLLGMDALDAQLAHVPRFREALRVLTDDGLATRLGDRVGVSRAAVRFDALVPL
jgi:hypothetical protein